MQIRNAVGAQGGGLGRRDVLKGAVALTAAGLTAGCVDSGSAPPPPPPTAPVPSSAAVAKLTAPVADRYKPAVLATTVSNVGTNLEYSPGDSANNNAWTRAYYRKYGIQVQSLWQASGQSYTDKTNLMITSGDLPDFFMASESQFQQLVAAGSLEDLTDAYASEATENIKKLMAEAGDTALESATFDGKLMAIPFTSLVREASAILWARSDWMKKHGLSNLTSMDDLNKLTSAVSGNGVYGLALDKDLTMATGFMNGYHAYWDMWIAGSGGDLVYSSIQPEMKAALAGLQRMFAKKQIDPEFAVKDSTKANELITAGKIGAFYGGFGSGLVPLQTAVDSDPSAEAWQAYPIVSADSGVARPQVLQPAVSGYWVVRKGYKHPEVVLKMLDLWAIAFYYTTENDVYTTFNQSPKNPTLWESAAVQAYRGFKNTDIGVNIEKLLKGNIDPSAVTPETRDMLSKIKSWKSGDKRNWCWNAIYGIGGGTDVIEGYRKANQWELDKYIGPPTKTQATRGSTLQALALTTATSIIKGAPLSTFDNFVTQWRAQGGDTITKEVNEWRAQR